MPRFGLNLLYTLAFPPSAFLIQTLQCEIWKAKLGSIVNLIVVIYDVYYHIVLSMWMLTWNYKWKNITSNLNVYIRSRPTAQITAHLSSVTGWIKREVWLLANKTVQADGRGAAWWKLTSRTQFTLILGWTATELNYFKGENGTKQQWHSI